MDEPATDARVSCVGRNGHLGQLEDATRTGHQRYTRNDRAVSRGSPPHHQNVPTALDDATERVIQNSAVSGLDLKQLADPLFIEFLERASILGGTNGCNRQGYVTLLGYFANSASPLSSIIR